jgi:hypothetical protein
MIMKHAILTTTLLIGLGLILGATSSLLAQTENGADQNTGSREDEMFGSDAAEAPPSAETPQPSEVPATDAAQPVALPQANSREDAIWGTATQPPANGEMNLDGKLDRADQTLAIGGQLFMRLQGKASLFENNSADQVDLASPNLLDIYFDGRPSDRLRAYIRGRVAYDYTVADGSMDVWGNEQHSTEVMLDQMWLKFDLARTAFVTLGRQPVKWGTGYFWNPSDFLNQAHKDPLASFDERLGLNLIKVHLPIENLGWNFYAIADLTEANTAQKIGGAFRAEILLGTVELALSTAVKKDQPFRLGSDLSFGLWWFDFRFEGAVFKGDERVYYKGDLDLNQGLDGIIADIATIKTYQRQDEWIPQLSAGLELDIPFGTEDSLIVGLEYFYNDAGYADSSLYPILMIPPEQMQASSGSATPSSSTTSPTYSPLYIGRHYLGAYFLLAAPGRWDNTSFILSLLGNLSDETGLARFDYRVKLLTYLDFNAYLNYHFGRDGEFHYSLSVPPIPNTDLADGLEIAPPLADVGIGLLLKF